MAFCRQWLLVLFALILGGEPLFAASARENRAFAAAAKAFQDGIYDGAETEFGEFIQTYPKSDRVAEALLMQAQAEFKQGKLTEAINRLTEGKAQAGALAAEYVYWIGQAQFKAGNHQAAAATFNSLVKDFPDSPLRMRAVVEAASALTASALADPAVWPQVVALLEATNGVFQSAVQVDAGSDLVARGKLLLAQAKFEQKDFAGAARVLETIDPRMLTPELDWQRAYLLCESRLAGGENEAALTAATNLYQIAVLEKNDGLRAESLAMQAGVLEKLGRIDEAAAVYRMNLTNTAPAGRQRQAVLKIAGLAIAQNQYSNAVTALERLLKQYSNSPVADLALLTLGELELKNYAASRQTVPATNLLTAAQARFDQFLAAYTNSPLAGKAYLDRGWCFWLGEKYPESLHDFWLAAQTLPVSEDLAVARFKLADAQFKNNDFAGARSNYLAVLDEFTNFPAVGRALDEQALYQSLRASLALNDLPGASTVLERILKRYPKGELTDNAILLAGEGVADCGRPAVARALFQQFASQFPDSELRPQAELAVARSYEQEQDWTNAIHQYENWQQLFPTNALRPQVEYALALANFQAGNETNAFLLSTNFIARFPTNEFAPLAQWWVADHFFRAGDYANAERNYKSVFQNTNWQGSPLAWQAQMMAGRAVVARTDYAGAIRDYFTKLEEDTNCPIDLRVQATFAHGDALMRWESPDTNNPLANFQAATNVFGQIYQLYPTNEWGALALFYIGECDVQLGNYDGAVSTFTQVLDSPAADVAARSQAQIGIGIALEAKAAQSEDPERMELMHTALGNYTDVLYEKNLRDGEQADSFWRKKAGLQAASLAESLADFQVATNVYLRLEGLFPQARDSFQKKINEIQAHLSAQKSDAPFDNHAGRP